MVKGDFITRAVLTVTGYFSRRLSPTQPLIESDPTECLSGGFPVLMSGVLNAKHTDWNFRLTTASGSLLRDYANRNICLIHGPDSPTSAPFTENATPDVLDTVVVKDFVLPVHLFVLHSAYLRILIDTTCRPSFQNLLD
jgi:hypothetical protein